MTGAPGTALAESELGEVVEVMRGEAVEVGAGSWKNGRFSVHASAPHSDSASSREKLSGFLTIGLWETSTSESNFPYYIIAMIRQKLLRLICAVRRQRIASLLGSAGPLFLVFALSLVPACSFQTWQEASVTSASPLATETPSEHADIAGYCESLRNSSDPFFGTQQRQHLTNELENPTFDTSTWRISILRELARDHLRFGQAEQAIQLLFDALRSDRTEGEKVSHEADLLHALAIASMKMAELDNCLSPDGRLICVLPLDGSRVQQDRKGADAATEHLGQLLELEPDNISAIWLLNVAHMALGSYPEGVPTEFLVAPSEFESAYDIGRFDEIAPYAGLYAVNTAGGSIIEDFDNDGLLDVMTSTWDPCKPLAYYRNEGDGTFTDYTVKAGLSGQLGGLNITQADFNNDGWMDVLVMRGGWMKIRGRMRVSLLKNDGDNSFTDVTEEAGIAKPAYPGQSASWADYDNDGDLDFYACNESMPEPGVESATLIFPSQLFRSNGKGQFEDVAQGAGVQNWRYCKGSAWGDHNNDGYPDLYVSNFGEDNRLYHNNGDGTFSDISSDLGVTEPLDSFATWFWDYDNDGWLDIFVAGYGENIAEVAEDRLGTHGDGERPRLYRNDGAGGFEDVTREMRLWRVHLSMGADFGDLDNDGYPDLYLGTGAPAFDALEPNVMYRNDGGRRFQDVTFSGGFGHLQKGHGVSFGDLDRDGDQDIFVQVGGFFPGDGFINALYKNPGHGNRWISLRLVGVRSNRAAFDSRIRIQVENEDGTSRSVYSLIGSGSSFGGSTFTGEIGLGQAHRILSLEVYWPASGIRQTFADVPLDSHIRIVEGKDGFEVLDLPPVPLGIR